MMRRRLTTIVVCTALTLGLVGGPAGLAAAQAPDTADGATVTPTPAPEATPTPTPEPTAPADDGTDPGGTAPEGSVPGEAPDETAPDETAPDETKSDETTPDETESDDVAPQADELAAASEAAVPAAGRIDGVDRYMRSAAASRASFPSGATTVLVANGTANAGPVMAASLARAYDAPLLYTGTSTVPSSVMTELKRLAPEKIVAVAGSSDMNERLLTALRTVAPVERVVLTSQFSGSIVALKLAAPTTTVYFTGNLQDQAAALGSAAAAGGFAMMVNGRASAISAGSIAMLRDKGVTTVRVVGSESSIGSSYAASLRDAGFTVSRVDGADVYARTLAAARTAPSTPRFIVANPAVPSDAASAGALGAVTGQPVVYTPYQCMLKDISALIRSRAATVVGVGREPWLRSAAVRNISCTDEKPRLRAALESAIASTAARYPGRYAWTVREFTRVGEAGHNALGSTMLEPASMMKLYAAWAALKRIQDGRASTSTKLAGGTTLGTCLKVMIHASDNFCHTDIVHWIGISNLNRLIADAGFGHTRYGSVPRGTSVLYAGNRTTTDDLTLFLQKLDKGVLLDRKYADVLRGYMKSQIWRSRIASGIPSGVAQESKPGALWIASGLLQADSAIIRGPQATFAVSIIGIDGPSKAALRAITRTVYTHFHGSFGTAATYPVKQMVTTTTAPLRSSPAGAQVRTIGAGTLIEVVDAQRWWYQVRWGDRLLWMDSRKLRNR